jgi:2-(1,2-epoxy-1,2-dihydrophenyl)acetyl-CoA isomerase
MDQDLLILNKENGLATLTLNRPDKFNAMTTDMWRQIPRLIEEVRNDDSLKVLIITGTGKAFCAGSDAGRIASRISPTSAVSRFKKFFAALGPDRRHIST